MSQGNDLANFAPSVDDKSTASEDVWFVAVASDDIKQMTIDQLDESFRLGIISAQTAVWTEGMENWAPLGEVANLDDSESSDDSENGAHHAGGQHGSGVFGAVSGGFDFGPSGSGPRVAEQPSMLPGPSSFAPVTSSLSPASIFSAPGAAPLAASGPVALNVDDDAAPVARGRRFRPERWVLGAAALIALAVTGYNNRDIFSSGASSTVAAAEAPESAPKAFATRPYDGAEKPSAAASSGAAAPSEAAAAKPKAAGTEGDAPIGSAQISARGVAPEAASPAPIGEPKEDLKGNVSKALSKKEKAAAAKAAKTAKAHKSSSAHTASTMTATSHTASKSAKGAKKSSAPKAASAFDPLNDSLP